MKQLALDIGLASGPTLDNYLPGPNAAALEHLRLWVGGGSHARTRSPVPGYLWGPSGSGRTHLLEATRAALREQGATVGWMDAGEPDPGPYDEGWSLVLLDDVHLYTPLQQHAAFTWFVQAQSHQRGVLASGDVAPAGLLHLREDLRTRLGWGHVFGLSVLSEPERRAVLRQAADARGLFLSDDVMDYLLTRFSRDLGSLMQLLEQLDGYALRTQRAITVPLVRAMMDEA